MLNYRIEKRDFDSIREFSSFDKAYQSGDARLRPFYRLEPTLENFAEAIKSKAFSQSERDQLVASISRQYQGLGIDKDRAVEIDLMGKTNTFCVCTAHQPVLFGGPLYLIYKIASVINLAETLNKEYSDVHILPVFVVGGEDHDFEEMRHCHVFGKTLTWQTIQKGAVGRFSLDGIDQVRDELFGLMGSGPNADHMRMIISHALENVDSYAQFYHKFIHAIFRDTPLLVINMDDDVLKSSFSPMMEREITERVSKRIIESTQKNLLELGFRKQAHAREINLFYLDEYGRHQIKWESARFSINEKSMTQEEVLELLHRTPRSFSPNVVFRPLYQEYCLPSLAYVGGGGELAYWMERKAQFEAFEVPFPILVRRKSVLLVDARIKAKIDKLNSRMDDLFMQQAELNRRWIDDNKRMDFSLVAEKHELDNLLERLSNKAVEVDASLKGYSSSVKAKMVKSLDDLEKKVYRAQKSKFENEIDQLNRLKERLFPGNGLQERYDNFIPYFLKYGMEIIDMLDNELDPLDKSFDTIIFES